VEGKDEIKLLGKVYPVKVPPQFAVREELVFAYGDAEGNVSRKLRVASAALGLCTPLGAEAGCDYVKARFDVLAYGGAVYSWLRQRGAAPVDILTQATPLIEWTALQVFPREDEVKAQADFTSPAGDG
jgi:hypothetical protein